MNKKIIGSIAILIISTIIIVIIVKVYNDSNTYDDYITQDIIYDSEDTAHQDAISSYEADNVSIELDGIEHFSDDAIEAINEYICNECIINGVMSESAYYYDETDTVVWFKSHNTDTIYEIPKTWEE